MAKTVYATLASGQRIGGVLDQAAGVVMVHVVNGQRIGGFNLSRFKGSTLTASTLAVLFNGQLERAQREVPTNANS